jgi:hypothetical protein
MNVNDTSSILGKAQKSKACPYLGLLDDSQTTLSFASPLNFCHHSNPVASPNLDYQHSFCLGGRQHTRCPVFTSSTAIPLPEDIRASRKKPVTQRRFLLPILLGCCAVILVVIGVVWARNYFSNPGAKPPVVIAAGTSTPTPTAIFLTTVTSLFTGTPTDMAAATLTGEPTGTPAPAASDTPTGVLTDTPGLP